MPYQLVKKEVVPERESGTGKSFDLLKRRHTYLTGRLA